MYHKLFLLISISFFSLNAMQKNIKKEDLVVYMQAREFFQHFEQKIVELKEKGELSTKYPIPKWPFVNEIRPECTKQGQVIIQRTNKLLTPIGSIPLLPLCTSIEKVLPHLKGQVIISETEQFKLDVSNSVTYNIIEKLGDVDIPSPIIFCKSPYHAMHYPDSNFYYFYERFDAQSTFARIEQQYNRLKSKAEGLSKERKLHINMLQLLEKDK